MGNAPAFFALLLLSSLASAEFLLGLDNKTNTASVRCDGKASVQVIPSQGAAQEIALDGGHQASFAADPQKSYVVQCGAESRTIAARDGSPSAEKIRQQEDYFLLLVALLLVGSFAAAAAIAAKVFLLDATEFSKTVENGRASLRLRAGRRMEKIEISDPVSLDGAADQKFSVPVLEKGREWRWSYAYPGEVARALPASLRAKTGGGELSLLSELLCEGRAQAWEELGSGSGETQGRRKVPKAD